MLLLVERSGVLLDTAAFTVLLTWRCCSWWGTPACCPTWRLQRCCLPAVLLQAGRPCVLLHAAPSTALPGAPTHLLVWGAGKQRASGMYYPGRGLIMLRLHLRMSFYGGTGVIRVVNIAGCWETAEKEMNSWIKNGGLYAAGGLKGAITNLRGADCAEMDSDADTPPPDFTATTLPTLLTTRRTQRELGSQITRRGQG
jgi:hypothetical protein